MNFKIWPLSILLVCLQLGLWAQKPVGTYQVAATNGLNLRATAAADGAKLATVAYGESVELLTESSSRGMVVDGLAGAMARVSYEGKTGYMFDGYLVDVIMPIRDETAEHYVGRLRSTGREAIYEKHTVDYGNYFTDDEAIHIASMTWPSSFLIASKLFLMPLNIPYPPDKGVGTKTTTFPADVFGNSTGDLETVYDDKGNLKRIAYYFRGGAGGYSVTVEPSTQNGYAFKISRHDFAD